MKRVANDVAVQTICYTIGGFTKIRIVDYHSDWDLFRKENGEIVFEGEASNFYGWKYHKISRSKVRDTSIDGDTIVFAIATVFDEY